MPKIELSLMWNKLIGLFRDGNPRQLMLEADV